MLDKRVKTVAMVSALALLVGCGGAIGQDEVVQDAAPQAATPQVAVETPPEITEYMQSPAILVFSKTAGWRHNEGIAGADRYFADLAHEKGYGLFTTANAAVFNAEDLARFDVVVFNNATGDGLTAEQEAAFQAWYAEEGAWIGLHGSGDASQNNWLWYQSTFIGPEFIGHIMAPQFQTARLVGLNLEHPVLADMPAVFELEDEWYSFDAPAQAHGMTPIVGLDETSYQPTNTVVADWPSDLRMGDDPADHPIIWSSCSGQGRSVYSGVGHTQFVYDSEDYQKLLSNAFDWVTRKTDPDGAFCPD